MQPSGAICRPMQQGATACTISTGSLRVVTGHTGSKTRHESGNFLDPRRRTIAPPPPGADRQ